MSVVRAHTSMDPDMHAYIAVGWIIKHPYARHRSRMARWVSPKRPQSQACGHVRAARLHSRLVGVRAPVSRCSTAKGDETSPGSMRGIGRQQTGHPFIRTLFGRHRR